MKGEVCVCVRGSLFFGVGGRKIVRWRAVVQTNKRLIHQKKFTLCRVWRTHQCDSYATAVRALVIRLTLGDASTRPRALFAHSVCSLQRKKRKDINSFHFLPP